MSGGELKHTVKVPTFPTPFSTFRGPNGPLLLDYNGQCLLGVPIDVELRPKIDQMGHTTIQITLKFNLLAIPPCDRLQNLGEVTGRTPIAISGVFFNVARTVH